MGMVDLLILIIIVGVLLWLVNAYIPMDAKIKKIFNVVVVVLLVLFILSLFVPANVLNVRVGR